MQSARTNSDLGQAPANALRAVPRYVQYTSPVSVGAPSDDAGSGSGEGLRANALPLNLIGHIVSYLDDVGDIARVTRTSRLLYYMTVPQLYQRVHLRSYDEIRYINGRPEGYGSGSPFTMALNGLITKQHAALVQEFGIWGEWKEYGVEDFSKGRVPENSMMLNILIRAATDRMSKLQSFCWELNCKPLKTLYQGLAAHQTLTSLTLRFPSTRIPRPSVLVPPIPNLRVFKALDIDPLCYPDDISLLMLHSRKLEDVRLHFSPRMRQESEAISSLETYFGRCLKANYKLKVKHFGLQNFFGRNTYAMNEVFDMDTCRSVSFFDTFGGPGNDPRNIFIDETWRMIPKTMSTACTSIRLNEPAPQHIELMRRAQLGMENLYIVSAKRSKTRSVVGSTDSTPNPMTPDQTPEPCPEIAALKDDYIHTLTTYHGKTIKRLLLSDQWALTPDDISSIVHQCPNLEQIGLALNSPRHDALRLLLPFLPKLKAVRILRNEHLNEHFRIINSETRLWQMSLDTAKDIRMGIKYIGLGDVVYTTGKVFQDVDGNGNSFYRREIFVGDKSDVADIEMWRMDNPDISLDPIAPFSP